MDIEELKSYETIVGRSKEDLLKFSNEASGFIGRHIVGTGEDAHLTTPVRIDLLRPHVILVCGKRGSGKSYAAGTIIEEILSLKKEFIEKIACIVFDPVGIYWSLKLPNDQQIDLLRKWGLEAKGFEDRVKVYVPAELKEAYEKAGIPVDYPIKISVKEFYPEDWVLAFNLEKTGEIAISLTRNLNELLEKEVNFDLDDLIIKIKDDEKISLNSKNFLVSILEIAKSWGIFAKEGMNIYDIVKPNQVSIIDLSRARGEEWGLRNLIAAWISRQVYRERVIARKEEEIAKLEGRKIEKVFPLTWLIFEEAHNFIPADRDTVSSDAIKMIAKQGREPGISLVTITQMPGKVHQDVLSQTDIVISFRLTSMDDLKALHAVYQTYMAEDLEKLINKLPRLPGAAIILDDVLERIFTVNIRPRVSWHSGGTAALA